MSLLFSLVFFLLSLHVIERDDLDPRAHVTSCLWDCFLFSWPCSGRLFPGCCLSPGLLPSQYCSPLGCLFVLLFIMPFFNCHCGKTGMCHCLLLAAGVRKPNYQGSQCLNTTEVGLYMCVCVSVCVRLRLFWWAAVPGLLSVMAGDGYGYSRDSKEEEKAGRLIRDFSCAACCHPGTAQQPAPTVCLLATFNCCLML